MRREALMAAIELMESADPDEEMVGIMAAMQRTMAEDVEKEHEDAVLMAAAVAGQCPISRTCALPVPSRVGWWLGVSALPLVVPPTAGADAADTTHHAHTTQPTGGLALDGLGDVDPFEADALLVGQALPLHGARVLL